MSHDDRLISQGVNAALEAVFLTPAAVMAWWTDYLRSLASPKEGAMTFMIAAPDRVEGGLRVSSFEDASEVPEPGVEVVVSLPETGTHAIGRVERIDPAERVIYVDVDEDSRVWA